MVADKRWAAAVRDIEARVEAALRATCRYCAVADPVVVSVLLCDDETIHDLNRRYRGIDRATDTLSFPAAAPPGAVPLPLGDVVVAYERAAADAAAAGRGLADHLSHLLVHGCLHLLGHDHGEATEAQAMEALERDILASLGIADPYALR